MARVAAVAAEGVDDVGAAVVVDTFVVDDNQPWHVVVVDDIAVAAEEVAGRSIHCQKAASSFAVAAVVVAVVAADIGTDSVGPVAVADDHKACLAAVEKDTLHQSSVADHTEADHSRFQLSEARVETCLGWCVAVNKKSWSRWMRCLFVTLCHCDVLHSLH